MYSFDPEHPFTLVEPLDGESIASFLYRFRRAKGNRISSPSALGDLAGIGFAVCRWEKSRFKPRPTQKELEAISDVTQVTVDRLTDMFPHPGESSPPEPIRFCAACCAEEPYHRVKWYLKSTVGCNRHQLRLLSNCRGCGKSFEVSDLVGKEGCQKCGIPFKTLVKKQTTLVMHGNNDQLCK
jgi:hypothetical protein